MRVGVMGAGSIGCFVGGMLLGSDAAEVTFVGRERVGAELRAHGMTLRDFDRREVRVEPERVRFETEASALEGSDAVLVCVKSAQTEEVAKALAPVLSEGAIVVSLQNGVRNPETLRGHFARERVVPGIVGFNVVSLERGVFHRGFSGPLAIERSDRARALCAALRSSGLHVETPTDIAPHQWSKLLVNANNAVSALSGAPTRELLLSPGYRRVVAAVIDECLVVMHAAGVRPAKLRGLPAWAMPKVLRMPTPIVRLVTRAQMKVDPHAKSSMWEDLTRRRPTEVDYLNGEIVRLAERAGVDAPINRRVVELVHAAEKAGAGPPGLSAEALWEQLRSSDVTSARQRGTQ